METPFNYGKIASGENFTDRQAETEHLVGNFRSLINTIIVSPRRWGKSSLVSKSAQIAREEDEQLRVCRIDLFNVRSEEDFYKILAQTVIKESSSRWEESVEDAKKFFSRVIPKITIGGTPDSEMSFSFGWGDLKKEPDEILDLAEKIAEEKGIKIVVCIDEFQNVALFEDPLSFQRKLRSHWQQHQRVAYCLYGSKRHMMMDIFTDSSMPFYKFGDIFFLEKIDTRYLSVFIEDRFKATGKEITREARERIIALVSNHPYYTQQLSQLSWLRTGHDAPCDEVIVNQAFDSLVRQLSLIFATMTETLTSTQLSLLRAIISGERALTSSEVIIEFNLKSAISVSRAKKVLVQKDILDNVAGVISFQDPVYEAWLRNYFFK